MKDLVPFIVQKKQLFNLGESPRLRKFLYRPNTYYTLPSRRTLCRATDDEYDSYFNLITAKLVKLDSKISLTVNGWSSRIMRGYFVITADWLTDDWELKSDILYYQRFSLHDKKNTGHHNRKHY